MDWSVYMYGNGQKAKSAPFLLCSPGKRDHDTHITMSGLYLHVKDEALEGDAQIWRERLQLHLSPGIDFALAEVAEVLIVVLQALFAQQARLTQRAD